MKIEKLLKGRGHYVAMVAVWLVMAGIISYLQLIVYKGGLGENMLNIALWITAITIICFGLEDKNLIKKTEDNKWMKLFWSVGEVVWVILLVGGIVFFVHLLLYRNPYSLISYFFLIVIVVYLVPDIRILKENVPFLKNSIQKNVWSGIILCVLYAVATIALCLVLKPVTVNQGTSLVAEQGYQNVSYVSTIDIADEWTEEHWALMFNEGLPTVEQYEEKLGFYVYKGEGKDGNTMIVVSVVGGNIMYEIPVSESSYWDSYLKDREKSE